MIGILVLILRIVLAASLYGFIGWALVTIWRDLRSQGQRLSAPNIPALSLQLFEKESMDTFSTPEIILGRSSSCDYTIVDETVSARHARLSYHQNQWWIEDLGSTNGTYLNDERVSVPTVIISGDELRCGQVSLMLTVDEKVRQ